MIQPMKYPENPSEELEYSMKRKVGFYCHAPNADEDLVCTFNGWGPEATPMERDSEIEVDKRLEHLDFVIFPSFIRFLLDIEFW